MLKLSLNKTSIAVVLLSVLNATSAQSQIVPDRFGNSRIAPQGNTVLIEDGAVRGSNLFHSFQRFSVPTGGSAYFNNAANIQNIFSRVTGNSASSIDGILKANGTANLLFLNPNGIIFGKNAQLDIGGSFMGTTADSIQFPNEIEFSATSPQTSPLLTVNLPLGLVFGSNPGGINVTDSGHQLITQISSPISRAGTPLGLQVLPGKNLALLGGDVSLDGGILFAPGGQIELGSVKQGQIAIDTTPNRWAFNYQSQSTLGRIELTNRSFLDTSGDGGASLGIYGRQIFLKQDSTVVMQNQGAIPDKELRLTASELIDISSADLPETRPARLYSVSNDLNSGAQITLLSPDILVSDGGFIATRTFGSAQGGNISIKAPNSLNIIGSSPVNPLGISLITTLSFGSGAAGNIDINTSNLSLREGGRLSSATFKNGTGGKVSIQADTIEVIGLEPLAKQESSTIRSGSLGPGNAGSLVIDTSRLTLSNGGKINTATRTSGDGGELIINAQEFIEIIGSPGEDLSGAITAEATIGNPRILKIFNLPPDFSGNSGSITINTPQLSLKNGARISVLNDGTGDAGALKVSANTISLKGGSFISATTNGGEGGNVTLNTNLTSLEDSSITASAKKKGTGGNISTFADFVIARGNSSITAEAEDAQGGNIFITAKAAIFGPNVDLSVSSKAGIQLDGNLVLDVEDTAVEETTAPAPDVVTTPKVISACNPSTGPSRFVVMGPGALKVQPRSIGPSSLDWNRKVSTRQSKQPPIDTSQLPKIVEANSWQKTNDDKIMLIATPKNNQVDLTTANSACKNISS